MIKKFILVIILTTLFVGCSDSSIDTTHYKPGMKVSNWKTATLLYADQRKRVFYYHSLHNSRNLAGHTVVLDSTDMILRIYQGVKN